MRPNSEKVLAFLQEHSDKEYTKQDLVEELDVPMAAVTGSVNGLVKKGLDGIKVLGNGSLEKKLTIQANKFSTSAIEKIEKSGSKAEVI